MRKAEYDVVVVGAGVGGLSAAVSAAEAGARTAVVERSTQQESGGNTRFTEAFMRMDSVGEPAADFEEHFRNNAGGNVDPALLSLALDDESRWPPLLRAMNVANPGIIADFAAAAGPTLQWLETQGVRFERLPTPFITTSTSRLAPVGGGEELLVQLRESAASFGVDFHFETTAKSLVRDEDGQITGVECSQRGEGRVQLLGKVVLASGGFEGNAEMLARYIGPRAIHTRPVARGGHYNKGEGIQMALDVGAAPCGDYGLFHAEPIDPRSGIAEPALFIFPYGILVNRQGQRFVDEAPGTVDATYESVTRKIFDQEGGTAFVILDGKLDDVPNKGSAIRTDQPPIVADSLEALAGKLEIPVEAFVATVHEYNDACVDGDFDPLGLDGLQTQDLGIQKSNWARPIDTPDYIAYPIAAANVFTFGGLKTDSDARVLDLDGDPIPGLYAAGEVVGLYFGTYTGSTSVLKGAVFGRKAGVDAAKVAAKSS